MSEQLFQYLGAPYWYFIEWMANPVAYSTSAASSHQQQLQNYFVLRSKFVYLTDDFNSTCVIDEDNQRHIQCLIELAAVVLGSSSDSHFWTHLFEPDFIRTEFLPGSMVGNYANDITC